MWLLDVYMTIRDSTAWDFAGLSSFRREFKKRVWTQEKYRNSWFSYIDSPKHGPRFEDGYIHAEVIKFSGKGMVLCLGPILPSNYGFGRIEKSAGAPNGKEDSGKIVPLINAG